MNLTGSSLAPTLNVAAVPAPARMSVRGSLALILGASACGWIALAILVGLPAV